MFLLDVYDGIFPPKAETDVQTPDEAKVYEEERRLYYVAMTRAKDELYLFRSSSPSAFTAEAMSYLPVKAIEEDDFVGIFLQLQIGKSFPDRQYGDGRIIAQCEDQYFIAFSGNEKHLFSRYDLLDRYNRQPVARTRKNTPPKEPSRLLLGPWRILLTKQLTDSIKVGGRVRHKTFGPGVVKNIENGIVTIVFDQVGEKKLLLEALISGGLLQKYNATADISSGAS